MKAHRPARFKGAGMRPRVWVLSGLRCWGYPQLRKKRMPNRQRRKPGEGAMRSSGGEPRRTGARQGRYTRGRTDVGPTLPGNRAPRPTQKARDELWKTSGTHGFREHHEPRFWSPETLEPSPDRNRFCILKPSPEPSLFIAFAVL